MSFTKTHESSIYSGKTKYIYIYNIYIYELSKNHDAQPIQHKVVVSKFIYLFLALSGEDSYFDYPPGN